MGLRQWFNRKWAKSKTDLAAEDANRTARKLRGKSAADPKPSCEAGRPANAISYNVQDHLKSLFYNLKINEITLDAYEYEIYETRADIRQAMAKARSCRKYMDAHSFNNAMEVLEIELEECLARLSWIDNQRYRQSIRRDIGSGKGDWARFRYTDSDGFMSIHSITMWECRGEYIVGYDRSRKGERTFRQDRIDDWVAG